jgi:hypothetical protein
MPHELGSIGRGYDLHPNLILMFKFQISHSTRPCSLSSDISDRYNNLKASWDSLMEASHGNPRSFYIAATVVLEQLKREELKRKNAESKK